MVNIFILNSRLINFDGENNMAKLVYFDNLLVKFLISKPNRWNSLIDVFIKRFGQFARPIYSYVLFLEYIGFHKSTLKKPDESTVELLKRISDEEQAAQCTKKIAIALQTYFDQASNEILVQLLSPKIRKEIFKGIVNQIPLESSFASSVELREILFKDMIQLFFSDYMVFAERMALFLAWDYFCDISTKRFVRKAQLGIWLQSWRAGELFPLGKIIDDLPDFHLLASKDAADFKGIEDMVDVEAHTYALIGLINDQKELESVKVLTFDPPASVRARVKMGVNAILKIQEETKEDVRRFSGTVFCLNLDTFEILDEIEVQIPIFLHDLESSSRNAEKTV
jgi:hypothetical protein